MITETLVAETISDLRAAKTDLHHVEAKKAAGGAPATLHETISAFANSEGGLLILGLDESDGFRPVTIDVGRCQRAIEQVAAAMSPRLAPTIQVMKVDDTPIVVAEILPLDTTERPCTYSPNGQLSGAWERVGDGDRKLTGLELQRALANRGAPTFDFTPVRSEGIGPARIDDLDSRLVRQYVERVQEQAVPLRQMELEDVLVQTAVIARTDDGPVVTLGGLLALGTFPQRWFPQLRVTITEHATVDGPTDEVRARDDHSLTGPIPVIVGEALSVLKRMMRRTAIVQAVGRRDHWEYPEVALREAIVNALVHRALDPNSATTAVRIDVFPDRVTFSNPGGLHGVQNVDELGTAMAPPTPRNQNLVRILEDTPGPGSRMVLENRGTGMLTIFRETRDHGIAPPTISARLSEFGITFDNYSLMDHPLVARVAKAHRDLDRRSLMAVWRMATSGTVSTQRLARDTGADSKDASADISRLVDLEIATRIGAGKNSHYILTDLWGDGRRPIHLDDIDERILRELDTKVMSRADLATATGINDQTVVRHLNKLIEGDLVRRNGKPRSKNTTYARLDVRADQPAADKPVVTELPREVSAVLDEPSAPVADETPSSDTLF